MKKKRIGILAVQGAFEEHRIVLEKLGAQVFEIRQKNDLEVHAMDGLILPGGESTTQGKLLRDLKLFEPLQKKIQNGLPVLATCAGAILLAEKISNDDNCYFATLPAVVQRNAYGRQLGSFITNAEVNGIGTFKMNFIRAPFFEKILSDEVKILSEVDGRIVAVEYKNQIALAFHPEIGVDMRIHEYFLKMKF